MYSFSKILWNGSFENESNDRIKGISYEIFFEKWKKNMEYLQYLRFSSYFAFSRDEAPFRGTFSNGIHRYERVDSIGELVVTPVIHENEIPKEEIG